MNDLDCKPGTSELPAGLFDRPGEGHLYCPHCDYDLTGAPTNRCPECGNDFDPQKLHSWLYGRDQPLPVKSFLQLVRMSLFHPRRLGRMLPAHPSKADALRYAWQVRYLVIGVLSIGTLGLGLLPSLIVVAVSGVCESVAANTISRFVRPRYDNPSPDSTIWPVLMLCFSTFLLLSSCAFVLTLFALLLLTPSGSSGSVAIWCSLALVDAWWLLCLGLAVSARARTRTGRVMTIIPILLIGLATVGLAVGIVMAAEMECFRA